MTEHEGLRWSINSFLSPKSFELLSVTPQSGSVINEGNIVDLLADNLPKDICYSEIGLALLAGFNKRFPMSIRRLAFRV
jgi:hypothetical protein